MSHFLFLFTDKPQTELDVIPKVMRAIYLFLLIATETQMDIFLLITIVV